MSQADRTTTSRRTLLASAIAGVALAGAVGANAAVIASASSNADPIFRVIQDHRDAQEELFAACEANDLGMDKCPRKSAAEQRAHEVDLPLFSTPPTTVLGVAALLLYVLSEAHEICREEEGQTVIEYAWGWQNNVELLDALDRFHEHVTTAFRSITEGGDA